MTSGTLNHRAHPAAAGRSIALRSNWQTARRRAGIVALASLLLGGCAAVRTSDSESAAGTVAMGRGAPEGRVAADVQPPAALLEPMPAPTTPAPSTLAPATPAPSTSPFDPAWADIAKTLERQGVLHDAVYKVTVPRDDLDVSIEGMAVPTSAGVESVFWFYRCPCGKMNVAGQFVVADYETNDVIDELRRNAVLMVAGLSPFLQYEKPRLQLIRFQGEGDAVAMAKAIREALRWTGKERLAPQPLHRDLPR